MSSSSSDRGGWFRHSILLALGGALVLLYVLFADVGKVLDRILTINPSSIFMAVGLAVFAYIPRIWSLRYLSQNSAEPLTVRESLRAGVGSNVLNLLLPARLGDLATITSLSRNRSPPDAGALIVAWRSLSILALLCLWGAFLAFAMVGLDTSIGWLAGTFLAGMLLASLAAFVLGLGVHRGLPLGEGMAGWLRRSRSLGKVADWISSFLHRGVALFRPGSMVLPASALCLVWIFDLGVAAVFIIDLVPEAPLWLAFTAPIIANLSKLARLTPGGIGIYEGVLSGLLVAAGGEVSAAVAAAAVGHGFLNLFMLLLGAVPAYRIGHRTSLTVTDGADWVTGSTSVLSASGDTD